MPIAFIVVVAGAIASDLYLRRSRRGLEARFTGLDLTAAQRAGIRTKNVQVA